MPCTLRIPLKRVTLSYNHQTRMLSFLVSHISDINCPEFGYKTGVKDHVGYFPIHAMSQELGEKMPRAVLAFHAITG